MQALSIFAEKINMKLLNSHLGRLRLIGFLEGMSFLILMGIGMPLKYYGGYPHATQDIGMAHGVLFILYVILVFPVKNEYNWSIKTTALALLASVLPFGTFVADAKIFKKYSLKTKAVGID
jgi:integral membrane protein